MQEEDMILADSNIKFLHIFTVLWIYKVDKAKFISLLRCFHFPTFDYRKIYKGTKDIRDRLRAGKSERAYAESARQESGGARSYGVRGKKRHSISGYAAYQIYATPLVFTTYITSTTSTRASSCHPHVCAPFWRTRSLGLSRSLSDLARRGCGRV